MTNIIICVIVHISDKHIGTGKHTDRQFRILGGYLTYPYLLKGAVSMVKNPDRYFYPAVFSYEERQEISVVFPDLGVATSGTNDADALISARELLGCVLFGLEEDNTQIPSPTRLIDVRLEANERAVLIDVFMPSVRRAQVNRSVNRTVTLPAWLNAAAQERNINFSQLLQDALKAEIGTL